MWLLSEEQLSDGMLDLVETSDAVTERVEAVVSPERWKSITESYAPCPHACDVCGAEKRTWKFVIKNRSAVDWLRSFWYVILLGVKILSRIASWKG